MNTNERTPLTLFAHTPPEGSDNWHRLDDHLRAVAELAAQFGAPFGAGDVCRVLGAAHDLGKADPRFQHYLRACQAGERGASVPHAVAGAAALRAHLGPFALAVMGHHGGLCDACEAAGRMGQADPLTTAAAASLAEALAGADRPDVVEEWLRGRPHMDETRLEMLIRICFSALTDADFLDTEKHLDRRKAGRRGGYEGIGWYNERLDEHMSRLAEHSSDTAVNRARNEILQACREAASHAPGAFRLTVPTGGGKTLSGLAFALRHALQHGHTRVIFAVPYTSIIDQTAQVYGDIFGPDNLLEHHSAVDVEETGEGQTIAELRRRLAAENWDCRLILTTTVQLFDSLFARRPSRCRKLHRIANSVIVLDEAQALPPPLLGPVLDVLAELVASYGCTVVFCSATQPDFSGITGSLLARAYEIVQEHRRYFEELRRVEYQFEPEPMTHEALAGQIAAQEQILCVLNTRKDAVRVLQACGTAPDLFHLSTLLCPAHRKSVLQEVRKRLTAGKPVRLVSTQVVEAGVDLDFPLVMRVVGPLDRIVQVAGRCNREGLNPEGGRCVVFQLEGAGAPRGPYATGIGLTHTLVAKDISAIDQPEAVGRYFRELYRYCETDAARIRELRRALAYRKVAEAFQMIPDDTVSIVTLNYAPKKTDELLATPVERRDAMWYRAVALHSVAVPRHEFCGLQAAGHVWQESGGMWVYGGPYSPLIGIGGGEERDPADLVA